MTKPKLSARAVLESIVEETDDPLPLYLDSELTEQAAGDLRNNVMLNIGRAVGQSMREQEP